MDGATYEKRARNAVRARDFSKLRRILAKVDSKNAWTPKLQIWAANLAREDGELERAETLFAAALEAEPDNAPAWFNRGLTLRALKRLEGAGECFERSMNRGRVHRPSLINLGEVLVELGQRDAADSLFSFGVERGVLGHPAQRPAHFVPDLEAKPFWSERDIPGLSRIDPGLVREEILGVIGGPDTGEWRSPALMRGTWKKLFFGVRGTLNAALDDRCPHLMSELRRLPLVQDLPEGNLCASVLAARTELHPHCGPTNARLRAHLGLVIPEESGLEVAGETRVWEEGGWIVFDDSFEHRAWNRSDEDRVILIIDVWHPELATTDAQTEARRWLPAR